MQKDKLISTKGTYKGKDKKGRDTLALVLSPDQLSDLAAVVQGIGENVTEHGARITLYTGKQRTKDGSREFDSTFFFVTHNQPKAGGKSSFGGSKPATTRFVPRSSVKQLG